VAKNEINFSKARIDSLPLSAQGERATYHDTKTRGLQLRVTSSGIKTFSVFRWVGSRPERITLGRYPDLSVDQARRKAAEANAAIARGENPAEGKRAVRAEPTLGYVFDEYLEGHAKLHTKTWPDMEANFRRYLSGWKARRLSTIRKTDVQRLHSDIGRKRGRYAANRALELLRATINWGIDKKIVNRKLLEDSENPAHGVEPFREKTRERFLQSDELPRFFRALAEKPNETIRDYIMISLLTGARKSNVLEMRWEHVNLERATWYIAETKNGEAQTIPLTPEAVAILTHGKPAEPATFVFPGPGKGGHLIEPKKGWKRILTRGGLKDLRLHDLRRTLGSWQAATGASLPIIGKSLGHKDVSTTAIYARLNLDPVRKAMETATSAMLAAAGVAPDAEVIELRHNKS
jgi:integrase